VLAQPNGGIIAANQFTNYSYEGQDKAGSLAVTAIGTGYFNRNVFAAIVSWDTTTAIDLSGSTLFQNNLFEGTLNGGQLVQSSYATNVLLDVGSSLLLAPSGWKNDLIGQNLYATGGVTGQGAKLGRIGSGGALLAAQLPISGTADAVDVENASNQGLHIHGDGSAQLDGSVTIQGTLTADGGVNGQGIVCGRDGSSGGAYCGPSLGISGTGHAICLRDGAGNTVFCTLGNGTTQVGNGSNVVYRCTTAGTLPVGALTTTASNCGAYATTSLAVN
jgi:hypothetical protein